MSDHRIHVDDDVMVEDEDVAWISPRALAARLYLAVPTVYDWHRRGVGPPGYKIVGSLRYRLSDVERWERELVESQGGAG